MAASSECGRDELQASAEAVFASMSSGDLRSLELDENLRYTENGEVTMLGRGLWRSAPRREYARHFLDGSRCSSLSVAVLRDGVNRIVLAMRLRHRDGRLSEVESVYVGPNGRWFRPDGIIPMGPDPWLEPVPMSARMSRDALAMMAQQYFESVIDPSLLPAHAPDCTVLQNGAPVGLSCGETPGNERYEQLRYLVTDERVGVVTTVAWNNGVLAMYMFKAQAYTMQSIEAVGGMYTANSGW